MRSNYTGRKRPRKRPIADFTAACFVLSVMLMFSLLLAPSASSTSVSTDGPGAPQNLQAEEGDGQIILTWEAPLYDGGMAIKGYKVYCGPTEQTMGVIASLGNVTSYANTGLTNGVTYVYKVRAFTDASDGDMSDAVYAKPYTYPGAPMGLQASLNDDLQVTLSWRAPSDGGDVITFYNIYRGAASGTEVLLSKKLAGTLSFTDAAPVCGAMNYYVVTAENGKGEGGNSTEVSVDVPFRAPYAPVNVTVVAGDGGAELTWSAPYDGGSPITGYNIYLGSSSGGETLLASVGVTITSYSLSGLQNDQTYYLTMTAVNVFGDGNASAEVSFIPTAPNPPSSPSSPPPSPDLLLIGIVAAIAAIALVAAYMVVKKKR